MTFAIIGLFITVIPAIIALVLSSQVRSRAGQTTASLAAANRAKALGIAGIITSIIVPFIVAGVVIGAVNGSDTDYTSFSAGQCFNRIPNGSGQVSVDRVSCSSPHNAQATGSITAPSGTWPGPDGFSQLAASTCQDDAQGYLSGPPPDNVEVAFVYPTQQDWNDGQRKVLCDIRTVDGSKITGQWPTSSGAGTRVST